MIYTHRNGETDPPITDGWYWLRHVPNGAEGMEKLHWWVGNGSRYLYFENDEGVESRSPDDFGYDYQWWGPVVPPWDDVDDARRWVMGD